MNVKIWFWVLILLAQSGLAAPGWSERVGRLQQVLAMSDSLLALGQAADVVAMLPPLMDDDDLGTEVMWPLEQRLGLALQALGRYEEALPHLERATLWAQLDPVNHRNLANLLLQMGKRGRAFSEYRDACSLAPGNWDVRVEFGHVLMDFEQIGRAAQVLREAEAQCPECPEVARAMVRLHLLRSDFHQALPFITALHDVAPTAETREQLALVLLRTDHPDLARDLLIADWPDRLSGVERRIVLEADRSLGESDRALALADAPQAGWDDSDLWGLAALICYDAGDDVAGLALVDRAIALAPVDAMLRNNRVAFLLRLGRTAEADREWGIVLQLDPSLAVNRQD